MTETENTSRSEGVVLVAHSGHCRVHCAHGPVDCRVRGRLKQGPRESRTVAVAGDQVIITLADDGLTGVIEEVLPRRNKISRMSSKRDRGRIEQVMMANLDQVVVVQSLLQPAPVAGFADRLLVAAERFDVHGVLCLNKVDLAPEAAASPHWDHYSKLGYTVLHTSAETGEGVDAFHDLLRGKISLLLGASGTGKSSLLAAATGLDLRVGEVTEKTGLGRHTTTRTDLFALDDGGYIADSPGIRGFDAWDLEPQDLRSYFPEFVNPGARCRFTSCIHRDEPDCAVQAEVTLGRIPDWRYDAYLGMLKDLMGSSDKQGHQRRKRN